MKKQVYLIKIMVISTQKFQCKAVCLHLSIFFMNTQHRNRKRWQSFKTRRYQKITWCDIFCSACYNKPNTDIWNHSCIL